MKNLLASIIAAAVVALLVIGFFKQTPIHSTAAETSAYEKVLKTGELRCGYVNWNPYFIVDPNNPEKRSGVNVEITEEIGRILGLKIVWAEEVGWGNLAEGLVTGRYDAVCTPVWPDAAKIRNLALSDTIVFDALYPYVRADEKRFNSLGDLNQPSVGVVVTEGGPSYEIAQKALPAAKLVSIAPNSLTGESFLMVVSKKADVMITSPSEFREFDVTNPHQLKRLEGVPPIRLMPTVMSFGANGGQLRDRVNFALQMMVDNGDMEKIVRKYSGDYILRKARHGID